MTKFQKATVLFFREVDFLIVTRNIHQVVSNTVSVEVAAIVEAVARRGVALIEEAEVVVLLPSVVDACNNAVGNHVATVLHGGEVRTVDSVEALPSRSGVGTGHTAHFLHNGVRVGCHHVQILHGLCVHCEVEYQAVTLVSVGKHAGVVNLFLGIVSEVGRIDQTVVGTVEACPCVVWSLNVVVLQHHIVDLLCVDELCCESEGEAYRHCIVGSDGSLPYLRHLEAWVDTCYGWAPCLVGK